MAKRIGEHVRVELSDSAKRKLADAQRQGLLGSGAAAGAASSIRSRKAANESALQSASDVLRKRKNQSSPPGSGR